MAKEQAIKVIKEGEGHFGIFNYQALLMFADKFIIKFNNMALIKCIECGNEVSDKASNCPRCGNPISAKIQTIELTSKKWKMVKLISVLLIIIGSFMGFGNIDTGNELSMWVGFNILSIGFILLFIGKLGAWWTNR
jgi:ribosomal protein L37E